MSFEEQIMSKDKYLNIFLCQIAAIVFNYPSNMFLNACSFENWGINH